MLQDDRDAHPADAFAQELVPKATYLVRARATSSFGPGPYGSWYSITTRGVPDSVSTLQQGAKSTNFVQFFWSAPNYYLSPILEYELVLTQDIGQGQIITTTSTVSLSSFVKNDLNPGETVQITVRARNEYGFGTFSSELQMTTDPPRIPNIPVAPLISDVTAFQLTLRWTVPVEAPEIERYTIAKYKAGAFVSNTSYTAPQAGSQATVVFDNLISQQEYSFALAAYNGEAMSGLGPFNSTVTVGAQPGMPEATVSDITNVSFALSWGEPTNPSSSPISMYTVELCRFDSCGATAVNWTTSNLSVVLPFSGEGVPSLMASLEPQSQYKVRVAAENSLGLGEFGEYVSVQMEGVPAMVGMLQLSFRTSTALTFTWQAPLDYGAGIIAYELEKNNLTLVDNLEGLLFSDSGLEPAETNSYRVRARNEYGWGAWSLASDFQTKFARVPTLPVAPFIVNVQAFQLTLSWTVPSGIPSIESYTIAKYEAGAFVSNTTVSALSAGSAQSVIMTDLQPQQDYSFALAAYNGEAMSGLGPAASRTTAGAAPFAPAAAVSDITNVSFALSWGEPTNPSSSPISMYTVELCRFDSCGATAVNWTTSNLSVVLPFSGEGVPSLMASLEPQSQYKVRVAAENSLGLGEFGEYVSVQMEGVPAMVGMLQLSFRTSTALTFTWQAPLDYGAGIIAYELEKNNLTLVDNLEGLLFSDSGLEPAETNSYRVRARNEYGWGAWSPPKQASTTAAQPVLPNLPYLKHRGRTSLVWAWVAAEGNGHEITGYEAQIKQDEGSWSDGVELGLGLEWNVTDLLPFTTYFVRVRANSTGFAYGDWSYSYSGNTFDFPDAPSTPSQK